MLLSNKSMTGTGAGAESCQETPAQFEFRNAFFNRRPLGPLPLHSMPWGLSSMLLCSLLLASLLMLGMVASISSLDTAHCRLLSHLVLVDTE